MIAAANADMLHKIRCPRRYSDWSSNQRPTPPEPSPPPSEEVAATALQIVAVYFISYLIIKCTGRRGLNLHSLIGAVFVLFGASAFSQDAATQSELKIALEECGKTFGDLVERDEFFGLETLCKPRFGDLGDVEFRVMMSSSPPSGLKKSDLLAFTDVFARGGFFLQPTSDPQTFKLGARLEGQDDFTYLIDFYGGIFSYAHFVDGRAIWIRCNKQTGACVYYDDLLHEASVTDRWGNQHSCNLTWSIVFPSPTSDEQITGYMNYILSFTKDFAAANSDKLLLGCLRPGQRIPASLEQ